MIYLRFGFKIENRVFSNVFIYTLGKWYLLYKEETRSDGYAGNKVCISTAWR